MPKEFPRKLRVGVQIQRELTTLINEGYADARLKLVTLTEVDVSPDLRAARVFVSRMGLDVADAVTALNAQAGSLRGELARRLRLRYAPELRFEADATPDQAARIDQLLRGKPRADR